MNVKRMVLILLILVVLAGSSLAMASVDFSVHWLQNLSGSGGPIMSSPQYHSALTVGQTAIFKSQSEKFAVFMGFWSAFPLNAVFLPVIVR